MKMFQLIADLQSLRKRPGNMKKRIAPDDNFEDDDEFADLSDNVSSYDSDEGLASVRGSLEELEDRDGAIAELRRRAPEVTVTLVKHDEQVSRIVINQYFFISFLGDFLHI